MDWILLDNKPFKTLTDRLDQITNKLDELNKKVTDLDKKNKNLENFLIHNQKLYLKHFNIICDILQENRGLYMNKLQTGNEEIESLKPMLKNLEVQHPDKTTPPDPNLVARFNNLVWRTSNVLSPTDHVNTNFLTTPNVNKNLYKHTHETQSDTD